MPHRTLVMQFVLLHWSLCLFGLCRSLVVCWVMLECMSRTDHSGRYIYIYIKPCRVGNTGGWAGERQTDCPNNLDWGSWVVLISLSSSFSIDQLQLVLGLSPTSRRQAGVKVADICTAAGWHCKLCLTLWMYKTQVVYATNMICGEGNARQCNDGVRWRMECFDQQVSTMMECYDQQCVLIYNAKGKMKHAGNMLCI